MNKIFLKKRFIFLLLSLVLIQNTSYAYIGPGLGGGVIAATIGIIVAIFAALFGSPARKWRGWPRVRAYEASLACCGTNTAVRRLQGIPSGKDSSKYFPLHNYTEQCMLEDSPMLRPRFV